MSVPSHIAEEIRRLDPDLRLRWSRQKRKFVVERKVDRNLTPAPVKWFKEQGRIKFRRLPEYSDRYIQYKDGYTGIFYCPVADRRIIWALYDSYTFRMRNYVKEVEYQERKMEEKKDEKHAETLGEMAGDSYGFLNRHLDPCI